MDKAQIEVEGKLDLNPAPNQQGRVIRLTQKREAVPLRTVMKEVLVDLYCKGIIPKAVTQRVYDLLKLKRA